MRQIEYRRVYCLERSTEMREIADEARTETLHETYMRLANNWLKRAAEGQKAELAEEISSAALGS
jgi:hypothetical protein